jgi:hypothetical protein
MFTTFRTATLTGKPRIQICDFGYLTGAHPKFSSEAGAQAYIAKALKGPKKVAAALAVKAEADAFIARVKRA